MARLVRLKLRDLNSFWFMKPISLSANSPLSPTLDLDKLTETQVSVIDGSISARKIIIVDGNGNPINGYVKDVNVICGNNVSIDDSDEEEDSYVIPEIVSIQDSGKLEDVQNKVFELIRTDLEKDASIFLKKNGNTVKKAILSMGNSKEDQMFLKVCYELEKDSKGRRSIMRTIEDVLGSV